MTGRYLIDNNHIEEIVDFDLIAWRYRAHCDAAE